MSKFLQWLIGICFVLVTAAIVFSLVAPFVLPRVGLAVTGAGPQVGRGFAFGGPGRMFGGPGMMGGRGIIGGFRFPFMGLGMLIVPLVVIGLIVLFVALLTRRNPAPGQAQMAPAPAAQMPAPAAAMPAPATTPCAHCGQLLEAGWKACPYCGEKI